MTWSIDPTHSSIEFSVRHLGISTVRGRFRSFSGTVEVAPDGRPTALEARIDATSIDTGVEQRDAHLRSPDFFDTEQHPEILFRSTAVTAARDGKLRVTGDLSIKGQARPVSFEVELTAAMRDPWGNIRTAASATGLLDRRDWGLTWNQALEFGGWVVGDTIRFAIEVEAVAPQAVAA
ncbi:MAG TPA: YceI family protein [Gemmatimonadales bacterium]|nr:YceI family protein [Gemmatimonadales bacterium]